jgi:hypothetical protein
MKILIIPSKEILDSISQDDKNDADFIAYRITDLCKTLDSYKKAIRYFSVYRIVKNRIIDNLVIKPHTDKAVWGLIEFSLNELESRMKRTR